jgi:mannose-6-phosphate isomerase-like protein (cupin superfamily)
MKRWFEHIARGPVPAALALSILFTAVAVRFAPAGREPAEPVFYETRGALAPEEGEVLATHAVGAHPDASVHHLLVLEGVKAHYHRDHDETVVVLSGKGRMTIGGAVREVGPGSVLLMPRSTVHALEVTDGPLEAVSVFSPPFDGKDRVFVD